MDKSKQEITKERKDKDKKTSEVIKMASVAIESFQNVTATAAAPFSSTAEGATTVQLPTNNNNNNNDNGGTATTGTSDSMATGNFDIAEAVAALNESGDEYTESLIEITRCRSRGSIIPGGNAASGVGGSRRRSSATSRRTSFGSSIIMHATRRRRSRMSSGRTSSSGESLLTTSRSKSGQARSVKATLIQSNFTMKSSSKQSKE